ncbi:hypothetical protein ACS5PK_22205, partial [Roseateles sp. DB2]|uniref:hypothetical protein n=2 Tax=Roseateles sp. DB2 TaxID=3453717 RepID=UPI003EE88537
FYESVLKMNKNVIAGLVAVGALVASTSASAAVDYSAITGAFTPADIVVGVMAVAGALAVVDVSIRGARTVLGMLRGR